MTKTYSRKSNYEQTLDCMLCEYDYPCKDFTYREFQHAASQFVKWEEKNMPKDEEGWPDWSMVMEAESIEDIPVEVWHQDDKKYHPCSNWEEALCIFLDEGKLPRVKQH